MSFEQKMTILIVDDTPDNISLLCSLLGDRYRNKVATNGPKALKIAEATPHPDCELSRKMRIFVTIDENEKEAKKVFFE